MNSTVYRIFVTGRVIPQEVETSGPREYFLAHYHNYHEGLPRLEKECRPEEAPLGSWGVCGFGVTPEEALERLYVRLRSLGIELPKTQDASLRGRG